MMDKKAFWNGFFKGLAAPAMLFGSAADLPATLDDLRAELDEIVPPKTVMDDMAAVYGDFVRALERTT